MPRELLAVAPRTPAFREYRDEPLQPGEIRARLEYAAPKHGTELHLYRGDSAFADSHWDAREKVFLPGPPPAGAYATFPLPLGNMVVGTVTEAASDVDGVAVGDRVAGYAPLRETQRWRWGATSVYPQVRKMGPGMAWQAAVCLDPAQVALGGVRDGHVRPGDRVAVFGLGAIGLLAVQLARVAGAGFVAAVDPLAARREVAAQTGADLVVDPTAEDAGLVIRRAAGQGVDVALETSGNARALHHAIRGLAFGGTVAVTGWYSETRGGLDLGREAHLNRPRLVFTRVESEPHDDDPRWNAPRLADATWGLLVAGRLRCEPIVQPVVPFDEAADAYREYVDEHPERSVKLGVRVGDAP
jgi:2-desacetyl-2-hydroxyethyl bacteriochlorophyllide A dehydrogenase